MMVWEGVAGGAMFSLGAGGLMAAYALALGANNLQVGILASLPFLTQFLQLPAILMVERFRARKAIGVPFLLMGQLMWVPIGAVPFVMDTPGAPAVAVVIVLMALRGLFTPVWLTAWTSWMRDLVPREVMGTYYARRLALLTVAMAVVSLGGSFFVRWWQGEVSPDNEIFAYSLLLIGGALTFGILSPMAVSRAREPLMPAAAKSQQSALSVLSEPLRDKNFSHLVKFLFIWSLTSNLAIPFFAVYMLKELGLSLPVVIAFTVLSQVTNVVFVRVWGPMADRVGSKAVLSLSASLYLLVILGWVFTDLSERSIYTIPLLTGLHAFTGVATAGVTLTVSTLALKVAPNDKATSFLSVASTGTNVGAGIGPIVGGLMADFFLERSLTFGLSWASPNGMLNLPSLSLAGYDFLFITAFVAGLLSLNMLVALREEGEVSRSVALEQLASRAQSAARAVSSVPGLGPLSAFSYGYLKRVPGADVALGVTAYQVAASTQAAVGSVKRGRGVMRNVAQAVGGAVEQAADKLDDVAVEGMELARHATRGAVQARDQFTEEMGDVVKGAVLGTVRTLAERQVEVREALRGAGYGVVQGAAEKGEDLAAAVSQAVGSAREIAAQVGIGEEEAAAALAAGATEAAAMLDEEARKTVNQALPGGVDEGNFLATPREAEAAGGDDVALHLRGAAAYDLADAPEVELAEPAPERRPFRVLR